MSPTVPPTSIKHTSGVWEEPSTGFLAMSSILTLMMSKDHSEWEGYDDECMYGQ